jgi:hypothetical protein
MPDPAEPSFVYSAVDATPLRGNANTETFVDECPPDSLLVGVNAEVSQGIVSRLQGLCGVPTIASAEPGTVSITPGETLQQQGCVPGSEVTRRCPAGSAVVGFEGRSGLLLDQLRLRCAPLLVANGVLSIGTPQALAPIGEAGGSPFQRADCADGALATGTHITVDGFVAGFGMPCATVSLEWRSL